MKQPGSQWRIFMRFFIWAFLENLSWKFKIHCNLIRITDTLHEDQFTFLVISRWILLKIRIISDKFGEKIKTPILFLCWTCVPCFNIFPEGTSPVSKYVWVDAYQELYIDVCILLYFIKCIFWLMPVPVAARGLRRRSTAARLLRSWVRIPPRAWMFVCCECCVWSLRRTDHSFRGVLPNVACRYMWSENLASEEAKAR